MAQPTPTIPTPPCPRLRYCDVCKAYDTVDRGYLTATLENLGAGAGFLGWVQLTLKDTRAVAAVNGCTQSNLSVP